MQQIKKKSDIREGKISSKEGKKKSVHRNWCTEYKWAKSGIISI